MLLSAASLLIVLLDPQARGAAPAPQSAARAGPRTMRSVTIRRVIMRVPAMPVPRMSLAPSRTLRPIVWQEKGAPRCMPASALAAFSITRPDAVDLVLAGGQRIRARLGDECPALDFYTGFYLRRSQDGMVCADRDVIRSRAGAECRIDGFRRLVPKR